MFPEGVRRNGLGAMTVVGVVAAVVVVILASARPSVAAPIGALLAGLVAMSTGAMLLLPGKRRAASRSSMVLIGLSILVWGVGQLLVAYELAAHGAVRPGVSEVFTLIAAPLAIASMVQAIRTRASGIDVARMGLDALLLGTVATFLLWRLIFERRLFTEQFGPGESLVTLSIVLAECTLVALVTLVFLRDLAKGLLVVVIGVLAFTVADLTAERGAGPVGATWPWQAAVIWCLALPTVALGVRLFAPVAGAAVTTLRGRDLQRADARVGFATTIGSLLMLIGALATVLYQRRFDDVTIAILLIVIMVSAAREIVVSMQRQSLLRALSDLAFRDPLTGLGNRRALTDRLAVLDALGETGVLTLDLDGFKEVNDVLGHARGDELLVSVAEHLKQCLPVGAQVFRIGGDEFAVLVPGSPHRSKMVAERLLSAVRASASSVPGVDAVQTSASVGVAQRGVDPVSPAGADSLSGLVESAVALRAAKEAGRDRIETYDGPVAAAHRRRLLVERQLREAITAGAVLPHYQPIVDLQTGLVAGFEALARWDDSLLGPVGPDEFIPVAERCGLIVALGASILRQCIEDVSALHRDHPDLGAMRVSVNVSVAQLRRPGFAEEVLAELDEHRLGPHSIAIEVTESLFIDTYDPAVRQLRKLRAAGVVVAIDDFGSGYSSLAYLSRMPADILKIDRALTAQLLFDERSRAVFRSITTLAISLPLKVIVEGVETADVHELVRDLGGDYGQGWLYGAAVPAAEMPIIVGAITAKAQGVRSPGA